MEDLKKKMVLRSTYTILLALNSFSVILQDDLGYSVKQNKSKITTNE